MVKEVLSKEMKDDMLDKDDFFFFFLNKGFREKEEFLTSFHTNKGILMTISFKE